MDHLLSKRCIQRDQMELVKKADVSRKRVGKLLDFIGNQDRTAFDELCNALEKIDLDHCTKLAVSLRKAADGHKDDCSKVSGMYGIVDNVSFAKHRRKGSSTWWMLRPVAMLAFYKINSFM